MKKKRKKTRLDKEIELLCKREGKKVQVSRGNMKEILSIISDRIAEDLFFRGHVEESPSYFRYTSSRFINSLRPGIDKRLKALNRKQKKRL